VLFDDGWPMETLLTVFAATMPEIGPVVTPAENQIQ
jgi:hypothetical protein